MPRWCLELGVSLLFALAQCGTPPPQAMSPSSVDPGSSTATPCHETGGQISRTSIPSAVYGAATSISIYLPPCYASGKKALPVIYLLHGANADETQWPDVRVQAEADTLIGHGTAPFIVVMPGGAYPPGVDYPSFVLTDLLSAVEQRFRVSTARADRAIGRQPTSRSLRALAAHEPNESRRAVLLKLAATEDKHTECWASRRRS
jgi:enterochelin esterase-like enzyme